MMSTKNSFSQYLKIKKSESVDECINYLLPLCDSNDWAKDELYNLLWSAHEDCRDSQLFELLSNDDKKISPSGMGFLGRL